MNAAMRLYATLRTASATIRDRMDQLEQERRETGSISLEYVILASIILIAVVALGVAVAAKLRDKTSTIENL